MNSTNSTQKVRPVVLDWNDWCDLCVVMRHLTWGNEASVAWHRMKERVEKRRLSENVTESDTGSDNPNSQ